jgi:hypothetical protein
MPAYRIAAILSRAFFYSLFVFIGLFLFGDALQSRGQTVQLASGPYQLIPTLSPASCSDVAGDSVANGAIVQIWTCGGTQSRNEYWSLNPVSGGYGSGYELVSLKSNLCLDVQGPSQYDGAKLQQWQCGGAAQTNQVWQIQQFGGAYQLVSVYSGKCLDLTGGITSPGNTLQQWDCGQGYNPNQLWALVPLAQAVVTPTAVASPTAVAAPSVVNAPTVPANYFGLTVMNFSNVQPSIPFGTSRSWDEYPYLDWAEVNPLPGVYNFAFVDSFINVNQQRGTDMIYTFGRTPLWASSSPLAYSPYGLGQCAPPGNIASWDAYVTALVTHAAGRIHYWELWNEPDDPQFYCGSISTMVTMANDAYRIIKSIDPSAQVLTPSVTSNAGPAWLTSYLNGGGGQVSDIITFHGYWGPNAESIKAVVQSYRAVMAATGQSTKPLWDTEASWAGDPTNILWGEPQRAAYIAKYYLLQWSDGVARFVWYAFDGGLGGGMWDAATGLHASGVGYGVVEQWMVGSQMTSGCAADGNGTWTCTLARNGDHAEVIWNSSATVTANVGSEYIEQTDLTGATTSVTGASVQVGNSPILLRTGGSF